ncbi:MAG: HNH endonuclease signature motif containing protein, partial [Steroidobacteraceae bacterium]
VQHWAHGGETRLSNLVTLCRFHHRLVHEGQVVVQILDDGAFRFVRPDGASFDSPLPATMDWTPETRITPSTAISRWTGEALDYDLAVAWLMQHERRATSSRRERLLFFPLQ